MDKSGSNIFHIHLVFMHDFFFCHAACKSTDNACNGNPRSTDNRFPVLYVWVYDNPLVHGFLLLSVPQG